MALTPDQTAVLELLLAGQSYCELEELLGLDEIEVRSRARAALTELGGADPDRNVGLSDYLLGQADPIGRADAARPLRQDTADHVLATTLSDSLAEIAPDADLQKLPPAPAAAAFWGEARRRRRPLPPRARAARLWPESRRSAVASTRAWQRRRSS